MRVRLFLDRPGKRYFWRSFFNRLDKRIEGKSHDFQTCSGKYRDGNTPDRGNTIGTEWQGQFNRCSDGRCGRCIAGRADHSRPRQRERGDGLLGSVHDYGIERRRVQRVGEVFGV